MKLSVLYNLHLLSTYRSACGGVQFFVVRVTGGLESVGNVSGFRRHDALDVVNIVRVLPITYNKYAASLNLLQIM